MFMARRPQKWRRASRTTAGHAGLTHRSATSPSSRTTGSAADRAPGRHLERRRAGGPLLREHAHHFRDDVAALLDDDGVAHPHVLAGEILVIVQGRPLDGRPAEQNRIEVRHRGQRSRPPDVDADLAHDGHGLLRRVLVGERPARGFGGRAELALDGPLVHLDHDPVGLELEPVALLLPLLDETSDVLEGLADPAVRVHRKSRATPGARAPRSGSPAWASPRRPRTPTRPAGVSRSPASRAGASSRRRRCGDWRRAAPPPPRARH